MLGLQLAIKYANDPVVSSLISVQAQRSLIPSTSCKSYLLGPDLFPYAVNAAVREDSVYVIAKSRICSLVTLQLQST